MHTTILKEIESIEQLHDKLGTAVSIFGSARILRGTSCSKS